jgi:hypothetical protein
MKIVLYVFLPLSLDPSFAAYIAAAEAKIYRTIQPVRMP